MNSSVGCGVGLKGRGCKRDANRLRRHVYDVAAARQEASNSHASLSSAQGNGGPAKPDRR